MDNSEILRQISNTLLINSQNLDKTGLLNGKMGLVIFFYLFSRKMNDPQTEEFAGCLLDEVLANIHTNASPDFEGGLSGIGWGIEYLVRNNYIDTEGVDVLEEIDGFLINQQNSSRYSNFPMIGNGIYFLSRIHKNHIFIELIINEIQQAISTADLPMTLMNNVLFLVSSLYPNTGVSSFHTLPDNIIHTINKKHPSGSDLAILKEFSKNLLLKYPESPKWNEVTQICEYLKQTAISYSVADWETFAWQNLVYFDLNLSPPRSYFAQVPSHIREAITDLKYADLPLYTGLPSIGLNLMTNMK